MDEIYPHSCLKIPMWLPQSAKSPGVRRNPPPHTHSAPSRLYEGRKADRDRNSQKDREEQALRL